MADVPKGQSTDNDSPSHVLDLLGRLFGGGKSGAAASGQGYALVGVLAVAVIGSLVAGFIVSGLAERVLGQAKALTSLAAPGSVADEGPPNAPERVDSAQRVALAPASEPGASEGPLAAQAVSAPGGNPPAAAPPVPAAPAAGPSSEPAPSAPPSSPPSPLPSQAAVPASAPSASPAAASSAPASPAAAGSARDTPTPAPTVTPTPVPVSISNSSSGSAVFTLSGLLPGDSVTRSLTTTNTGLTRFRYALSTSCAAGCGPGASGLLWTDPSNGLQLAISRGGTAVYNGPVQVGGQDMGITLGPGQTDTLTLRASLPAAAGNDHAGLSTTIVFTWTASQAP